MAGFLAAGESCHFHEFLLLLINNLVAAEELRRLVQAAQRTIIHFRNSLLQI
jgi:hypothetical protein